MSGGLGAVAHFLGLCKDFASTAREWSGVASIRTGNSDSCPRSWLVVRSMALDIAFLSVPGTTAGTARGSLRLLFLCVRKEDECRNYTGKGGS